MSQYLTMTTNQLTTDTIDQNLLLKTEETKHSLFAFLIIPIYWTVSFGLIYTNKLCLQSPDSDLSLILGIYQFIFGLVLSTIILVCQQYLSIKQVDTGLRKLIMDPYMALYSLLTGIMVMLNMLLIQNNTISTYSLNRMWCTVTTVALTRSINGQAISAFTLLGVMLTTVGYVVVLHGQADKSNIIGTIVVSALIGIVQSLAALTQSIILNRSVMRIVEMQYIVSFVCVAATAFALRLINPEWSGDALIIFNISPWLLVTNGFLSCIVGYVAAYHNVKLGVLGHAISINVRSAVQSVGAAVLEDTAIKAAEWWFGMMVVLIGSFVYTWAKIIDFKR